jgi:hypothetical protein
MWFYIPAAFLLVLALSGGVFAGGIFTLALVPLAVVAVISAVWYALWARASQSRAGGETDASPTTTRPLPHSKRRPGGKARTSPERLADARRIHH